MTSLSGETVKKKLWISDEMKDDLKKETDLLGLVQHFGCTEIKPAGNANQYKAKCIFPDCEEKKNDYPLGLNTEKQAFNCFHCGRGGDILKLIMTFKGLSFFEAKKFLMDFNRGATRDNIKGNLPEEKAPSSPVKEPYTPFRRRLKGLRVQDLPILEEKGIATKTAEKFGVGYCSQGTMKGRIVVPVFDSRLPGAEDQNILAYAGYSLTKKQKEFGDWKFPEGFEKGKELFNLNRVREETKHAKETLERYGVIVVESFWNVLKLSQAGFPNVVAIMGTALTFDQERLLLNITDKVKLWLDADEPGRKALTNILRTPKQGGNNGLIYKAHIKVIGPETKLAEKEISGKEKPYQFTEEEIREILK